MIINIKQHYGLNQNETGGEMNVDLFGKLEELPVLNSEIVYGKYFVYLCKLRSEILQVKKYLVYRPSIELIN